MTPSIAGYPGEQLSNKGLSLILFPPQLQITTKVNIWGQVYFGQTSSSLVSKIRNSAGMHMVWASNRELSLRDVLCYHLFVACLKCASNPLSCLSICADPLSMLRMLCPAHVDLRPLPWLLRIPAYIKSDPAVCPSQTASQPSKSSAHPVLLLLQNILLIPASTAFR